MIFILVFLFLAGCSVCDLRTGRIPNRWVFMWWVLLGIGAIMPGCGAEAGLAGVGGLAGGVGGLEGIDFGLAGGITAAEVLPETVDYLAGCCFTGIVLFPLFLFRMIGAGDIKMMFVLGGALGIRSGFTVIFYGLAASALWSLLYMAQKRILLKRIAYFLNYMKVLARMDSIPPYYCAERDGREAVFCLAPFILL